MIRFRLIILCFLAILAGCSNDAGKNTSKNVAAIVNGVEISESEVDYIYKQRATLNMKPIESFNLRKAIVSDLVKTQLLVQKARALNLDKTTEYPLAIYNAQNTVLAFMAQNKITESVKNTDVDIIDDIIRNNPNYFNNRKLYIYDEIVIDTTEKKILDEIDKTISPDISIAEIIDILRQKKVAYNYALKTLTSDNIPDELLTALDKLKPGKPQIIRVIDRYALILVLNGVYPSPVSGEQAKQKAAYLSKSKQTQIALSKELTSLVNNSTIKYFGDYNKKSNGNNLPLPDHRIAQKQQSKKLILLAVLSISVISAVMSLTAAMRFIKGVLWLPGIRYKKDKEESHDMIYDIAFELHIVHKLIIFLIATIFLSGIGYAVLFLIGKIPFYYILFSIMIGIITGMITSRLYSNTTIQAWQDKTFLIISALFLLPVFVNLLLILRFSNL